MKVSNSALSVPTLVASPSQAWIPLSESRSSSSLTAHPSLSHSASLSGSSEVSDSEFSLKKSWSDIAPPFSPITPFFHFVKEKWPDLLLILRMEAILVLACIAVAIPWGIFSLYANSRTLLEDGDISKLLPSHLHLMAVYETLAIIGIGLLSITCTFVFMFRFEKITKYVIWFVTILSVVIILVLAYFFKADFMLQVGIGYGGSVLVVVSLIIWLGKVTKNPSGLRRAGAALLGAIIVQFINDYTVVSAFVNNKDDAYRLFLRIVVNPFYFRVVLVVVKFLVRDMKVRRQDRQSFLLLFHCFNNSFLARIYSFSFNSLWMVAISSILTSGTDVLINFLLCKRDFLLRYSVFNKNPKYKRWLTPVFEEDVFFAHYQNFSRVTELAAIISVTGFRIMWVVAISNPHRDDIVLIAQAFIIQVVIELIAQIFSIFMEMYFGFKTTQLTREYKQVIWYCAVIALTEATLTAWKTYYIMSDLPLYD